MDGKYEVGAQIGEAGGPKMHLEDVLAKAT